MAQHVLFEHHPVELDIGILLLEGLGEALHADHVRVIDGGNGEGFGGLGQRNRGHAGGTEQQVECFHSWTPLPDQGLEALIVFVVTRVLRYERLAGITTPAVAARQSRDCTRFDTFLHSLDRGGLPAAAPSRPVAGLKSGALPRS
ncbi:hypothetical protein PXNS11_180066 [Stutzerimonas xanthomarina]|nr:hypothetical protein PXNS11_180066 [Stutzerimonas xanthomarina]